MRVFYIEIRPADTDESGPDTGPDPVIHRAFGILHGIFRRVKADAGSQPFAVGFPDRRRLQVFCADSTSLAMLRTELCRSPPMRDYALITPVDSVDITDETKLVEYARFRVPSNKSLKIGSGYEQRNRERRDRRIAEISKQNLLHFKMNSASTGGTPIIAVQVREWNGAFQPPVADSWGLSRQTSSFPVPVI